MVPVRPSAQQIRRLLSASSLQITASMGTGMGRVAPAAVVVAVLGGCVLTDPGGEAPRGDWVRHTVSRPGYAYTVEHPAGWAAEEGAAALRLAPPEATAPTEGIVVVVVDPAETPPPPVQYTYTTVRVIDAGGRAIPVLRRDPAPATEAYLVLLQAGRYVAEVRFALGDAHAAVFDHVVLSFSLQPR